MDSTKKSYLYQNDPNPFGSLTTIKYYIDEISTINSSFIEIRDLMGILKSTIPVSDESGIGQVNFNGNNLINGFYVYSLKINGVSKDSKLLLIEL